METFSAILAIWAGKWPAQRPVTRSFDVFLDLSPNKRLSKQWWGWWFETPSRPLCRHCNGFMRLMYAGSTRKPPRSPVDSPTKGSNTELRCFFAVHLNKHLKKLSSCWWFETPRCSCHYNVWIWSVYIQLTLWLINCITRIISTLLIYSTLNYKLVTDFII